MIICLQSKSFCGFIGKDARNLRKNLDLRILAAEWREDHEDETGGLCGRHIKPTGSGVRECHREKVLSVDVDIVYIHVESPMVIDYAARGSNCSFFPVRKCR